MQTHRMKLTLVKRCVPHADPNLLILQISLVIICECFWGVFFVCYVIVNFPSTLQYEYSCYLFCLFSLCTILVSNVWTRYFFPTKNSIICCPITLIFLLKKNKHFLIYSLFIFRFETQLIPMQIKGYSSSHTFYAIFSISNISESSSITCQNV